MKIEEIYLIYMDVYRRKPEYAVLDKDLADKLYQEELEDAAGTAREPIMQTVYVRYE